MTNRQYLKTAFAVPVKFVSDINFWVEQRPYVMITLEAIGFIAGACAVLGMLIAIR